MFGPSEPQVTTGSSNRQFTRASRRPQCPPHPPTHPPRGPQRAPPLPPTHRRARAPPPSPPRVHGLGPVRSPARPAAPGGGGPLRQRKSPRRWRRQGGGRGGARRLNCAQATRACPCGRPHARVASMRKRRRLHHRYNAIATRLWGLPLGQARVA